MEKNRIWKGKQWYLRALDEEIKDQDKLDFYYEELERYIKAGIQPLSVDGSINYVENWKLEKLDALDIYVNKRKRTIVNHYLVEKQFANSYQTKQTNNYAVNYQNRSNKVNKKRSSSIKYLLFAMLWIILIFMVIILVSVL
ncbi:hypothetical protein [Mycoplasma sp. HU2014]|uniref:hypothetical protein n=1 Tax=Mycoplasma sp. HU2014 TaxID=1664275 RepID=UPI00067AD27D|nr:hypothetical protein [Mycoplasma sp. HU2014]